MEDLDPTVLYLLQDDIEIVGADSDSDSDQEEAKLQMMTMAAANALRLVNI